MSSNFCGYVSTKRWIEPYDVSLWLFSGPSIVIIITVVIIIIIIIIIFIIIQIGKRQLHFIQLKQVLFDLNKLKDAAFMFTF